MTTPDTRSARPPAGTPVAAEGRGWLPMVLRSPAFGAVWTAQVLPQAAARMFQVGVVWWLVSQPAGTDRGFASGPFLAVSTLPALVLTPLVTKAAMRYPVLGNHLEARWLCLLPVGAALLLLGRRGRTTRPDTAMHHGAFPAAPSGAGR